MSNRPIFRSPIGGAKTARRRLIAGLLVAGLLVAGLLAASTRRTGTTELSLGPSPRAAPTTISWPDGQELPTFARPDSPLTYVDLTTASDDDRALVASLQGLVNRRRPRIYVGDGALEGNTTWAKSLHLAYTPTTIAGVLRRYARLATGLVVWDPSQPDTLNLATTIAGLWGGLVASPAQVPLLTAPPYRLRIVRDLRGRFFSRLAIYQYAYRVLWRRTTHKILVGLNPATQYDVLRDYAVANGLMVIYLDPSIPSEGALYDQFVASMPVDSAYMGWFPDDVSGETAGTTANSQHGVMTFAADYFLNMTVLAGTDRSITVPVAPVPPPLQHKIYVAFNVSDGDNMQENEHRMRQMWDDHTRGRVPLSWTISPGLVDAAPGLLRWYWRTATRNDELVAGVSGLGYVRPDQVPCGAYSAFTQRTSTYLNEAGLTVVHLLDSSDTLPACAARGYSDDIAALLGLVQSVNGPQAPRLLGSRYAAMPYVPMDGFQTSAGALVSAVQRGAAGWDGRSPRFIAVSGLAWDLMPGDFLSAMNTLRGQSAQYVFVRDDQLMMLMRQAHRLPPHNTNSTFFPFDSGTDGFIGATSGKRGDQARWDSTIGHPAGSLLLDGSDRGRPDSQPNAAFSQTLTLPPQATTLTFDTRSLDGRQAALSRGCETQGVATPWVSQCPVGAFGGRLRVRLVDAGGASHTLLNWATYRSATWAGRTATLVAYAGQTVTLYFEQDDSGAGHGQRRWVDNIVIHAAGLNHKRAKSSHQTGGNIRIATHVVEISGRRARSLGRDVRAMPGRVWPCAG